MNLREYLFYSNKSVTDMAHQLNITRSYLSHILSGTFPLSDKLAEKLESLTHGIVSPNNAVGKFSHPLAKKVIDQENKIIDINKKAMQIGDQNEQI